MKKIKLNKIFVLGLTALFSSALYADQVTALKPSVTTAKYEQQPQVAGYYQYSFGSYQITAILDGTMGIPTALFQGLSKAEIDQILKKYYEDQAQGVQTPVNAFLINKGNELILVDSGAASCYGPILGSMHDNLIKSGHQPDQVGAVLLTHLHLDHACGISNQGKANFPNATIYVAQNEYDFWLNPKSVEQLPKEKQADFLNTVKQIQATLAPYQATNRIKTFKIGDDIHGLKAISSAGHTPGHISFSFKEGENEIVFIGDIVNSYSIQFEKPRTSIEYDSNQQQAVQTRLKLFAEYAKDGQTIAAPHLPFPGIGHISAQEGESYQWIPIKFKN